MESTVTWREGMAFDAALDGFHLTIDAAPEHGGSDLGPRPKGMLLTALAGCTAMDVISILQKMRLDVKDFSVEASGELTDEHPRVFEQLLLTYRFVGEDLPLPKLHKAITLSQDRYCGVSAMLKKAAQVDWRVYVNDELVTFD